MNTLERIDLSDQGLQRPEIAGKKEKGGVIASDTESGGLFAGRHALLSIGACCSWSRETFLAYITAESQWGKTIEPEAVRVNGYSEERWAERGARPYGEVIKAFGDWLAERKKERPGAVHVCHNLAHDLSFYREAERICGLEIWHRYGWACSQLLFADLIREGVIQASSISLNTLAALSQWPFHRNQFHDALEDAQICLHGYHWLKKMEKQRLLRAEALLCQLAEWWREQDFDAERKARLNAAVFDVSNLVNAGTEA